MVATISPSSEITSSWAHLVAELRASAPATGAPLPVAVELSEVAGKPVLSVVSLVGLSSATTAVVPRDGYEELAGLDQDRRIRWVAEDLTATATALARNGVHLRNGFCATLAAKVLTGYHRISDAAPVSDLPERYHNLMWALATSGHTVGLHRLVELDSAAALTAGDLNASGLPWSADEHERILNAELGVPTGQDLHPNLARADRELAACFGGARFRWRTEIGEAFDGDGIAVRGSRLRDVEHLDHPAVPAFREWRRLDLLAHNYGRAWSARWVREGRWYPHFRPGGAVTGRWSAEGGGLQLPPPLRQCVRARPGRVLVVADIAQLDPRVLAALSSDQGLLSAAAGGDLYARVGAELGLSRQSAKEVVIRVLNGGRSSEDRRALALLRRRYPAAMSFLDESARQARTGEAVRTRLGRTMPMPESGEVRATVRAVRRTAEQHALLARVSRQARNFPVQATATELCAAMLASLRMLLRGRDISLVTVQHDEFVVEAAEDQVHEAQEVLRQALVLGSTWVLGPHAVELPLAIGSGPDWASAKP
ncbi:DNA polymerase-1 [Crossiella equi]|uniref:DNA-directed DNA polymerase n=1 Tax=Crossiella equi TaxID=130796 RepID=A0ABS5A3J6_9PSEU|nr:DNA polymerase [Crossiella equi]MBP2471153.1 DNA polymerase-1 [Crossiella equi]